MEPFQLLYPGSSRLITDWNEHCHFVIVIMSLLLSCSYQVTLAVLDDLLAVFFRQFRLPSQQLDNLALSWKIQKSKSEQTLVHFPHLLLITEKVEIMLQVESAQVLSDEVFIQLHWWACGDLLQFRLCSVDDGRDHLDCVRGVAEPAVNTVIIITVHVTRDLHRHVAPRCACSGRMRPSWHSAHCKQ